jgi:hypothetical protein
MREFKRPPALDDEPAEYLSAPPRDFDGPPRDFDGAPRDHDGAPRDYGDGFPLDAPGDYGDAFPLDGRDGFRRGGYDGDDDPE